MTRIPSSKIVISTLVLGVLGSTAIYAQEKYSLKTPAGIAFSDFKGYEDWAVISSARTDEVLKVIVGNPTMIEAFKAGVPGNGQPFPDGSKVAKLQWKPKKSTEAPFAVDVPDVEVVGEHINGGRSEFLGDQNDGSQRASIWGRGLVSCRRPPSSCHMYVTGVTIVATRPAAGSPIDRSAAPPATIPIA